MGDDIGLSAGPEQASRRRDPAPIPVRRGGGFILRSADGQAAECCPRGCHSRLSGTPLRSRSPSRRLRSRRPQARSEWLPTSTPMRRPITGARSCIGNAQTPPLARSVEPIRCASRPVGIVTTHWKACAPMAMAPTFPAGDGVPTGAALVGGLLHRRARADCGRGYLSWRKRSGLSQDGRKGYEASERGSDDADLGLRRAPRKHHARRPFTQPERAQFFFHTRFRGWFSKEAPCIEQVRFRRRGGSRKIASIVVPVVGWPALTAFTKVQPFLGHLVLSREQ